MDKQSNTLLEQYKLYVEMADRISQRRQSANNYFISVNVLLYSLLSYLIYIKFNTGVFFTIFLPGVIICCVWCSIIKSYKRLNTGKFKVIHEMEKKLNYQPYQREWEIVGKGKDKKLYQPFTEIELYVPWIFGIIYVFLFLGSVLNS